MDFCLFKSGDARRFELALEDAVKSCRNGSVKWDVNGTGTSALTSTKDGVTILGVDAGAYDVMNAVAKTLESPLLNVLYQEKSLWELSVNVDGKCVIRFSPAPSYWDDEWSPEDYYGTAEDLARIWGVPTGRIERYLVDWELGEVWLEEHKMMSPGYLKEGKAYAEDEHEYGNIWQGYDFMRALGGDPGSLRRFWIDLPPYVRP